MISRGRWCSNAPDKTHAGVADMAQPIIENNSGLAFETLYLPDENGQQMLVAIAKATFELRDSSRLVLAEKQIPVNLAGEHWGEPGESSWKYEPEGAFVKNAADVILIGSACAPHAGATQVDVAVRVGRVSKEVRVFGDRLWSKALGVVAMTAPEPFERIPLVYERAFGGREPTDDDGGIPKLYAANPVGTGFVSSRNRLEDGMKLPNLEDLRNPIRTCTDRPEPAGFGYVSPDWQPRASLAGTYDEAWFKDRMPLLPLDFDRRFFNSASNGLVCPGFLRGDEPVWIENASPGGVVSFNLPGLTPPECTVETTAGGSAKLSIELDTLIVNTDENLVFLIWRGHTALEHGPFDVRSIRAAMSSNQTEARLAYV